MRDSQETPTLDAMAESNRPLLRVVLPDLSAELAAGLVADGRPELAEQIPQLRIWERCGCGDSFCMSFYVGSKPAGAWGDEGEHESLMADVNRGMVVLDVVAGTIRYLEVLDRPEIGTALNTAIRGTE